MRLSLHLRQGRSPLSDLTLVELFAGIGGFSQAFHQHGVTTVAAVEIDPAARRVFNRNFPQAALFEDVTKVTGDDLRAVGFIPERGILTGGWPCQDISLAGRGAGLAGERSGLFSEVVRLLDELTPKWFVLENVPRLLSINGGRDMGTVVGALVERGYGVSYRVLDASAFGVPQRRRRVFFVGCFGDAGAASAEVLFEPEGLRGDSAKVCEKEPKAAVGSVYRFDASGRGGATVVGTLQTSQRGVPSTDEAAGGQLVVEHTHIDVAGRRETRISDRRGSRSRRAPDCVAALTAMGVGTCGPDDNQAQAGHLIAQWNFDGALREKYE